MKSFSDLRFIFQQLSLAEFVAFLYGTVIKKVDRNLHNGISHLLSFRSRGINVVRKGKYTLLNYGPFKFLMRRASSDFLVFDQIIVNEELKAIVDIVKSQKLQIRKIIDCGANIGMSSVYLSGNFPEAEVLAFEPEPENFSLFQQNILLSGNSKISAKNIGVWSRKAMLEHDTSFCPAKGWAFSVKESATGHGTFPVDTLDALAEQSAFHPVDYLKIDIEGAEYELLQEPQSWEKTLASTKIISIEVHEKKVSSIVVEEFLRARGFEITHHGELAIGWRK